MGFGKSVVIPTSHQLQIRFRIGHGNIRHVTGVRRLMGNFIRSVHPDLTPNFPAEALRINQRSLAELNAFIDRIETDHAWKLEHGPEVTRELPFFRAHVTRSGRMLPGRVLPLKLPLPTLSVSADETEREYAAVRLVRDSEIMMEQALVGFSDQPAVPPLFTKLGAGRAAFDKLWWEQTRDAMLRNALNGLDEAEVKRQEAMRVMAQKYEHQFLRKYTRIRSSKRRRRKLAAVAEKVEAKVMAKFKDWADSTPIHYQDEGPKEQTAKDRILQSGFHPDLVFVVPELQQEHRTEAIRRVCGMNLTSDADFWLLENLWKAMRGTSPPVPLVIATSDYKAHIDMGFVQVPWDFNVADLCDLLEEHLDDVRQGLEQRRDRGTVGAPPQLKNSPLTLTGNAHEGGFDDDDWSSESEDASDIEAVPD